MTAADHKVDYGPLTSLIGKWVGETGLDVAPDHDCEPCERKFIDELTFVGVGHVSNAGKQSLLAVKYHQLVKHCEDQNVLHDQIGHWLYEPSTGIVMHSLTIPRGVCVLAGGAAKTDGANTVFEVEANRGNETFGILQSPFMDQNARTDSFQMALTVTGDQLTYRQSTKLFIYGKQFDHVDSSELRRVQN